MLSAQENCTITVTRRTQSSRNSIGEVVYTTSTVYTNIPARIDFRRAKTQYLPDGERLVYNVKLVLRPSFVLQNQDSVTNSIDSITRKVVGIDTIFGPLNKVHHYIIMLLDL